MAPELLDDVAAVFYLLKDPASEYMVKEDLLAASQGKIALKKGAPISEGHDFKLFERIDHEKKGAVRLATWKAHWEECRHAEKRMRTDRQYGLYH